MYSKLQLAKKYLQYLLKASNGKGHGIHSPFVFEFVTKVMNDKNQYECYSPIEQLRSQLKRNTTVLSIEDFGAGSRTNAQKQRSISFIASTSLKPKKFGQLLFRASRFYKPQTILELGTSLGITSSYLASGNTDANLITMEGAKSVARVAETNFEKLNLHNIKVIQGNFDETLPSFLMDTSMIDLAFIDGNHRKGPTINYFEQLLPKLNDYSILIFDDIHWSKEMEDAWRIIQSHTKVTLTIDLFFIGLVFFRKEHKEKEHFIIRY
jgi:predicted O-methyltransferase YrrM